MQFGFEHQFENHHKRKSALSYLEIMRPIQYLGSKLRTIPYIVEFVDSIVPRPKIILDIFSGTTVVSQAMAKCGYQVISTDATSFSPIFGRALLGINRASSDLDEGELLSKLSRFIGTSELNGLFKPWLSDEIDALYHKDSYRLISLYNKVPQVWRNAFASKDLEAHFNNLEYNAGQPGFDIGGVISSYYSGTYFGISQAIYFDELRVGIENLTIANTITIWERDVLLTALLSVLSDCVFSAGKHFAQPHLIRSGKDLSFITKRIIQDRGIEVWPRFRQKVHEIFQKSLPYDQGNLAFTATLDELNSGSHNLDGVNLIYADPPYTAQQYSRFYHLPETLVSYQIPILQTNKGKITRGIYPIDRYKSPFCSKQKSPEAFRTLFALAKKTRASLLISYSDTYSGKTGNQRMIGLNNLLDICKVNSMPDKVFILQLGHEYRQFNANEFAVIDRSDKEYLIYSNPL